MSQTVSAIEVFVSDDASTADIQSVVDSFGDPRLHYLSLPRPGGLHANLNQCIRLGTAPYVAICQDDDFWFPDNLERLLKVMDRHPDVGMAHGAFRMVDSDTHVLNDWVSWCGLTSDTIESGSVFVRRSMANVARINMSSVVIRRTVLSNESFEVPDGVLCDVGMWLRLALRGDVAFVAKPLTALRIHTDSASVREGIATEELRFMTLRLIRLAKRTKYRFLATHGDQVDDADDLRAVSIRWTQRELLNTATRQSRSARWPIAGVLYLAQAVQIEPRLLTSRKTWRVLLAYLVGARGRRLASRLARRAKPSEVPRRPAVASKGPAKASSREEEGI